jgi:hypothetical protein
MPGLVPGIHVFRFLAKTWIAGSSPAMTSFVLASAGPPMTSLFCCQIDHPLSHEKASHTRIGIST